MLAADSQLLCRNLYKELSLQSGVARTLFSPKTFTVRKAKPAEAACGEISICRWLCKINIGLRCC